ncbi:hypothetical protein Ciccas_009246 [Cichlidogyrus casuarinus]|uniref:Uncharacterized protein n=1 Tax=Cichlidogyrus casuarinus TaxID=1844966 RepID=A0ABD2PXM0_9PLAT
MISRYGCWWIETTYVEDFRRNLAPFWMIIIQIIAVFVLGFYSLSFLLSLIYVFNRVKTFNRRRFLVHVLIVIQLINVVLIFIASFIFGWNWDNPFWMPHPNLNWPSWSYGLFILSGFFCLFAAFYFKCQDILERTSYQAQKLAFPLNNINPDQKIRMANIKLIPILRYRKMKKDLEKRFKEERSYYHNYYHADEA